MVSHLFILGAGASKPYRFPTGDELTDRLKVIALNAEHVVEHNIIDTIRNDKIKIHLCNIISENKEWLKLKIVDKLNSGDFVSFDDFLNRFKNYKQLGEYGKHLIVSALLEYENSSSLLTNTATNDEHWYKYVWREFSTEFLSESPRIGFITFNYDRSLEYYICKQLKAHCDNPDEQLNKIPIHHVYGSLGDLDKLSFGGNENIFSDIFSSLAKNIRTIHEVEQDSVKHSEIRNLIDGASKIYITGFGFHQSNIDLIFQNRFNAITMVNGYTYKQLEMHRHKRKFYPYLTYSDNTPDMRNYENNLDFIKQVFDIE